MSVKKVSILFSTAIIVILAITASNFTLPTYQDEGKDPPPGHLQPIDIEDEEYDRPGKEPSDKARQDNERLKDEARRQGEGKRPTVSFSGPDSRGTLIELSDGVTFQLPADVELDGFVASGTCIVKTCVETPFFILVRGDYRALLTTRSKELYIAAEMKDSPEYREAFRFASERFGELKMQPGADSSEVKK